MNISFELAHKIVKYLESHHEFYFPFRIVCETHSEECVNEIENVHGLTEHEHCNSFMLQENLQTLDHDTTAFLAQGFLQHITGESLASDLEKLLNGCSFPVEIQESSKIGDYGLVEFITGKREAYVECLHLVKTHCVLSSLQHKL